MESYHIIYEIDVEAESPIMAAKQVHGYMQDPTSYKPVLHVVDTSDNLSVIDLEKVR